MEVVMMILFDSGSGDGEKWKIITLRASVDTNVDTNVDANVDANVLTKNVKHLVEN